MTTQSLQSKNRTGQNIFSRPLSIFGVPVDRDIIFSDHNGRFNSKVEKRQRNLIVKSTFIKFFLHPDERLHGLTTAYSPTGMKEQIFTGPAFLLFKRAILIFTDKRMLHVPTRFNRSSHGAVSQVSYEDCETMYLKNRCLVVRYKTGEEETFLYIGRKEKRKIRSLIDALPAISKKSSHQPGRIYLCPNCTNPLETDSHQCSSCHLEFKTDLQARIRSILIPGGGYFYSRYPVMGVIIGLMETALVSYLVFTYTCFHQGIPIQFGLLSVLAFGLLLEKAIAAFHARHLIRNYLPESDDYAMRKV
jgi:uncharacterized protein YlaI